jgi:hypothetical protein
VRVAATELEGGCRIEANGRQVRGSVLQEEDDGVLEGQRVASTRDALGGLGPVVEQLPKADGPDAHRGAVVHGLELELAAGDVVVIDVRRRNGLAGTDLVERDRGVGVGVRAGATEPARAIHWRDVAHAKGVGDEPRDDEMQHRTRHRERDGPPRKDGVLAGRRVFVEGVGHRGSARSVRGDGAGWPRERVRRVAAQQ